MRILIPALLLLGACAQNKTWQEACFEKTTAGQGGLFGAKPAPVYNPVLTIREYEGRNLVYCDG